MGRNSISIIISTAAATRAAMVLIRTVATPRWCWWTEMMMRLATEEAATIPTGTGCSMLKLNLHKVILTTREAN